MRKVIMILICAFVMGYINAQETEKKEYYVYGVDFTHAKAYGVTETVHDFSKAFYGINMLLITEPDKYDFSRMFNRKVNVNIEPLLKINQECDYSELIVLHSQCEPLDYKEIIKMYELPEKQGIGVVFIAKQLNKVQGVALYDLVVFDIASREVIMHKMVAGEARGFGLRNYWAGSIYDIIKANKKLMR